MAQPGIQSGISVREMEVLDALGEHLSNAEIGAKLFISERTVESHVSSLLRKLGATDRRELADLATRLTYVDGAPTARPIPSPLNPPWSPGCGWPTSFPAGAWFVDLVPVGEPEMVGATVAAALGIGDRHEQSVEAAISATLGGGKRCSPSTTASTW
jgi:DNA-binding CsgD family transcriptional regulator